MRVKSPKQELNVIANPEHQPKSSLQQKMSQKLQSSKQQQKIPTAQHQQQLPFPSPSPKKREELKKVQDQIQVMKNKILLLKIQLQKQQQGIKMNKSRTQQVIRKKINVNKIQKYKVKDNSADIQRAQLLRIRNASYRESHQSEMQNIFKAIYLVKLDDAREIKNLSKSHRKKIEEMNQATYNEQIEKKKKVAEQHQRAKQKYQRYWKQKLVAIYEGQNKAKEEIEKTVSEKKDQLKQLRQQEIKLLESMSKIQAKQMQTKKQYLAALSLPVKDVAQALHRSKSSLDGSFSKQKSNPKMARMSSQLISNPKHSQNNQLLSKNSLGLSSLNNNSSMMVMNDNGENYDRGRQFKVPNSTVNKEKLKIILKELKRLEKKEKQQSG